MAVLRGHVLALLVLLGLAAAALASGAGRHQHQQRHRHRHGRKSARLTLIPSAPGASFADRARDDRHRHAYIRSKLVASRRRAAEVGASAFAMPLSSGAYTGTGQYFVRFRVGTPAQPFVLVADTGSDLTWVKCRGAAGPSSPPDAQPLEREFRPAASKSWAPIACSSDTCTSYVPFSLANCSSPASPCAYDYRYKDGSAARGVVGTDSATIALSGSGPDSSRRAKLQGVVLGCTASYDGQSFQSSDGVLSLGNSNISFASRATARFGGRFSYCLVDHLAPRNATSYLTFGPGPEDAAGPTPASAPAAPAEQTPLLLDRRMSPFYAVTIDSIAVAGEVLDIPADVWDVDRNGGAILDSGTSLTILATPAYRAVVAALSKQLAGLPRVTMDPFEYCYSWTAGAPEIPKLEVQFAGSATLEPPAKSYVIDAAPGVKCIGVQEGAWPGVSVIGNILQQEHLWEFDLRDRWLRFKHTRCAL
ncbi:Protein ASPARTIC PROTEASE IN GUARD CELL 1 [Dichanthelium oligosanthes]|uniref:Protein ASPARTIC PROTEASE IN GUARD CELL 1 n=1 Tax=Dichanthelium oligosanthes TaxID=888268 RepID=A0A1E5WAL5_9POAL|nr:Protein ASPARTIC PROTEASE IN GUARD CELL 1 [Dichanthelium oligosanthes]